ncbi:MAG TPA: DNA polymerase III subunit gamma/tau [Terriglobia bacterium]|nr:DNA polymerase III subunit gamma/tau [Terriglobia bacterium]
MSYQVIARKYRPQVFDDVVGQRLITDTLKNAVTHDRVAHGYIFSGARGVGKTTTARILAKAVNCAKGPTVTPDGTCDSCREITAGNSVDVLEIDAASNRGIDEIRELRETVRYLPARDRYKVFIIDEVHMLTTEAFNALLKTLEEPPPRSLFILATTEPHKLPPTILSRCQHFSFRLLDYAEIFSRLEYVCREEKIEADEGSLAAVTQAAEGSLRDALSLLDQVIAACGERLGEDHVRQLLGVVPSRFLSGMVEAIDAGDASRVLEQVNELANEGYEIGAFCAEFTRYIRNLMIAKSCGAESTLLQVPNDERKTLGELSKRLGEEDLARFFQILLRTQAELRYSLQPRFNLELGLVKLVHARRLAPLEGLLSELAGARQATAANQSEQAAAAALTTPAAPMASRATPGPAARTVPAAGPPVERKLESAAHGPAAIAVIRAAEGTSPAAPSSASEQEVVADPRLAAIKSLLFDQSKKFVSSCLDHVSGWRFENGEVRFTYARGNSGSVWADLLKGRENQEALRAACAEVLGQPVKIHVTLDEGEGKAVAARPNARERAGRDPRVGEFERRFECAWVEVKDLSRG